MIHKHKTGKKEKHAHSIPTLKKRVHHLRPPREPNLYPPNDPPGHEQAHHADEDDERLPERGRQRVVVCDDDLAVPELVDEVARLDGDGRAADGVEVRLLGADG